MSRHQNTPPPSRSAPASHSPNDASQSWRRPLFHTLATSYVALIFGVPFALAGAISAATAGPLGSAFSTSVAILAAVFAYPLVAGLLSLPHQRFVRPTRIATDVRLRAYFHRRLYGLCWTSLYYHTPIYWLVLTLPWLKAIVFRLFGYRGSLRFTIYPDTWIRDLPLLRIGAGAYLSNKATIGTNMILHDRTILVDEVEIGPGATIGHLACVAPGTRCGSDSQIGVGAMLGLRTRIGNRTDVGSGVMLEHGADLGAGSTIQVGAYIGGAARIGERVVIPPLAAVRSRTRVPDQSALDAALAWSRAKGASNGDDRRQPPRQPDAPTDDSGQS